MPGRSSSRIPAQRHFRSVTPKPRAKRPLSSTSSISADNNTHTLSAPSPRLKGPAKLKTAGPPKPAVKCKPAIKCKSEGSAQPDWIKMKDQQLLDQRLCDLKLSIKGTKIERRIEQLHNELAARGLRIKPHCWLSDDWFSPDGIPGIAIPFYLGHTRLMRLERSQMLEVEGGTKEWCMRILRHEAGHAIDTAFRLHRRKRYRETFGRYSDPYPEYYHPKPKSKNFVLHLEPWYAQSHPAEDFAETFAVWLQPGSRWRAKYAGWKALKKIEFVDQLMQEMAGQKPKVKSRATVDPIRQIKKTLRQHYQSRHARYEVDIPGSMDHDLKKLFPQTPKSRKNKTAAAFLQRNRDEFSRVVSQWSGEYQYNINQVLREMIERCRAMDLRVTGNEVELKQHVLVMLSLHAANYLHGGHHRVAL